MRLPVIFLPVNSLTRLSLHFLQLGGGFLAESPLYAIAKIVSYVWPKFLFCI